MTRRVLVVCTANVCRSPMAAAALAQALPGVAVASAGTHRTAVPVDPLAVAVCRERGADIAGHVPRRLDADMIRSDGADLVLTMTREHLREVATTERSSWSRAFTLREAVRRSAASDPGETWAHWLGALGNGRSPRDLLGADPADDIADPYGHGIDAIRRTADDIWALAGQLAASLHPLVTPG